VNFLGVQFGIDAILELLDKNLPDGGLPNSGLGSVTQWDGAHYGQDNYEPYTVEFCRAAFNLSYEQGWLSEKNDPNANYLEFTHQLLQQMSYCLQSAGAGRQ
jgi:hypothetical protein